MSVFLFTVKDPEASVRRYKRVLKLVSRGLTKSAAYKEANINRNTINNQKSMVELRKVNREQYNALRKQYQPNSCLFDFAKLCKGFCTVEPQLSAIKELKQQGKLLTIYNKK